MDLKRLVLGFFAWGFLALSSLAFFISISMALAPYEIGDLEKKVNAEYPDKIAELVGLAFPQLSEERLGNISIQNIRFLCFIRSSANTNITLPMELPLSDKDIDSLCTNAAKAASAAELRQLFISQKVHEASAEVFAALKTDYVNPYTSTYLPIFLILFLVFYAFSAIIYYLREGAIMPWLRTIAFHTFMNALGTVIILALVWLTLPSLLSSMVMGSPQLEQMLSQLPEQQRPIVDIFISDSINFVNEWMKGVIVHLLMIYGALALIGGLAWAGFSAVAKGEQAKK